MAASLICKTGGQWGGLVGIPISCVHSHYLSLSTTALLNSIKSRKLDVFFEAEEKIMGRATLERPLLEVRPVVIIQTSFGFIKESKFISLRKNIHDSIQSFAFCMQGKG